MPEQKLTENVIIGIVLMLGTFVGILLQMSADETVRPWKQVIANAVLNGMFTVGIYAVLMFTYPALPVMYAIAIASATSTIGRSTFLRLVEKWLKR